jgi:hypothetical protein
MIKPLTKVIRENFRRTVTWGVTTLPLKRNLILRFTKGGGAQETIKNNSMMDANQGVHLIGSGQYVDNT